MLLSEKQIVSQNKGKIMKIFAGALKGTNLTSPKDGSITRPTSAKIREAILHKVSEELQSSIFIDLFSGTGAVGIEAISRGAPGAYLVETNRNILKILRKNFSLAKERMNKQGYFPKPFQIMPIDVNKALRKISEQAADKTYIIWADPPYADALNWLKSIEQDSLEILPQTSLIIVETDRELIDNKDFVLKGWEQLFQKVYGGTAVTGWIPAEK